MNSLKIRRILSMVLALMLITLSLEDMGQVYGMTIRTSHQRDEEIGGIIVQYKEDVDVEDILDVEEGVKKKNKKAKFSIKNEEEAPALESPFSFFSVDVAIEAEEEETNKLRTEKKVEFYEAEDPEDLEALMATFIDDERVAYVQPDYILESYGTDQITEINPSLIGTVHKFAGNGLDIGLENAEDYLLGQSNVLIGILDSGIDINHPELRDSIFTNHAEIAGNGLDDDLNGFVDDAKGWDFLLDKPLDASNVSGYGHGTHLAGIITANRNDNAMTGIAPLFEVLPLKFMENGSGRTSDAIEAIHYAELMGVDILNCSWGSVHENQALKDAMAKSSMLFVAAAGNDKAERVNYPAAYDLPNVMAVGAVDAGGNLATFSNRGSGLDILAEGNQVVSTTPGNKFGMMSGTSVSAAFVSAAAAYVKAINYGDTPEKTIYRLTTFGKANGFDPSVSTTARVLDIFNAMTNDASAFVSKIPPKEEVFEYEIIEILHQYASYSLADSDSKRKLRLYTGGDDALFQALEASGFNLADASSIAPVLAKSDVLTAADFRALLTVHGNDMGYAMYQATIFSEFAGRFKHKLNIADHKPRFLSDGKTKPIKDAFIISGALPLNFNDVYTTTAVDLTTYLATISHSLSSDAIAIIDELSKVMTIHPGKIIDLVQNGTLTATQVRDTISNYRYDIAVANGEIVEASSVGDKVVPSEEDKFTFAPFKYSPTGSESISLNSGDLQFRDNVFSLEGINGLDLNLDMVYRSSLASVYDKSYGSSRGVLYNVRYRIEVKETDFNGKIRHELGDWENKIYSSYATAYQAQQILNAIPVEEDSEEVTEIASDFFTRRHSNSRLMGYNENGVKTYQGKWSSPAPSRKYINENGYKGHINRVPEKTIDGSIDPTVLSRWPNGKRRLVRETWVAIYEGLLNKGITLGEKTRRTKVAVELNPIFTGYSYYNSTSPDTYNEKQKMGIGWQLNLPSIQTDSGVLHFNGRTYKYQHTSLAGDSNLKDYGLKDIRLEKESNQFSNGDESSAYTLYLMNGLNHYFNSNGQLIGTKDRFGNRIKYNYSTFDGQKVVSKITDTVNRIINITYTQNSAARTVKFSVANTDQTVTYKLKRVPNHNSSDYKLVQKTDSMNRVTTFDYEEKKAFFSFIDNNKNTQNTYLLLKAVKRPSQVTTNYSYELATGNLGNHGYQESYRVKSRHDEFDFTNYNTINYSYAPSHYSGYPNQRDSDNLPANYSYWTKITDGLDNTTTHTFDKHHNIINTTSKYVDKPYKVAIKSYDGNDLLKKSVTKHVEGNLQLLEVDNYSYNNYGQVVAHWGPKASRNSNHEPTGTEHKTTYSYSGPYHIPVETIFKQDPGTTIRHTNTLTADSKAVQSKTVAVKKGSGAYVQAERTDFTYDSYGNAVEIKAYTGDNGWSDYTTTHNSFLDATPSRNGQFNGAYLTRTWSEGVKDIEGKLVEGSGANTDGLIDAKLSYNDIGLPITFVDGNGQTYGFTYDKLGRPTSYRYPNGTRKTLQYHDGVNKTVLTLEDSSKFEYRYDGFGNLVQEIDVATGKELMTYEYDIYQRPILVQNNSSVEGFMETNSFDHLGRLLSKDVSNQNEMSLERTIYKYWQAYDLSGDGQADTQKTQVTLLGDASSPSIVRTSYHDVLGNQTHTGKYSAGKEYLDAYTYDYLGHQTAFRPARAGQENWANRTPWTYSVDHRGRQLSATDPKGHKITSSFNALGWLMASKDAKNTLTSHTYDTLGRRIKTSTPFDNNHANVTTDKLWYYDNNGNIIREKATNNDLGATSPTYSVKNYAYDIMNRLTLSEAKTDVTNNQSIISQYHHDARGNMVRQYTGLHAPITINGLDQIVNGADTSYAVTKMTYDRFNQMTRYEDPLGQATTYAYNLNGVMTRKTDRKGQVTTYKHDGMGRLKKEQVTTDAGSEQRTFNYTATGFLASTSDGLETTTYKYDDLGRLITEGTSTGVTKQFTYDLSDNKITQAITYGGRTVTNARYDYDQLDRLEKVYEDGNLLATYGYDPNGNRASLTYNGPGIVTIYTYNNANLLTRLDNKKGATTLSSYAYSHNLAGNRRSATDHTGLVTHYAYDDIGRLRSEQKGTDPTITYSYDDYSNRATMVVGTVSSTTYTYNPNNWLTHERVTAGNEVTTVDYSYDKNGNLFARKEATIVNDVTSEPLSISLAVVSDASSGPSFETYTYNGFNQMIGMTNNNHEATYGYDVQGIRNRKTVDGQETRQITHEGLVVGEANSYGQVTATYNFGINLLSANHGSGREYYLFNGHGDVVQIGDGSGNVLRNYAYDAFGNMATYDAGDKNPFTYSGEYYDKESENYYLRARYYKPGIGRFISEDSYRGNVRDPLSLNLYTYTRNNPVMYVDPSGHREVIDAYGRVSHIREEGTSQDVSASGMEVYHWYNVMQGDIANGDYGYALMDVPLLVDEIMGASVDNYTDMWARFAYYGANGNISHDDAELLGDLIFSSNMMVISEGLMGSWNGMNQSYNKIVAGAQSNQTSIGYNVDDFTTVTLKEGDIIYGMTPGQGQWYTTMEMVEKSGYNYKAMYNGLQIKPHPTFGYRTSVTAYEVTQDVTVATGQALANTGAGTGGYTQFFIDDFVDVLRAVNKIPLN